MSEITPWLTSPVVAASGSQFSVVDWSIVVGYLVFSTWLGAKMAGKQATIRDFFLGGRKLPWYAVCGSIIATEISALTFVVVPFVVFKPEGNFTYLQLGVFGTFFARVIVGYWLVPEYYKREIYSPYDYMGHRLGGGVRGMTTALFALGGVLAQSARVYLTAQVLGVLLHDQLTYLSTTFGLDHLAWAIIMIGVVATIWTLIGGIATVIWTDVLLFLLFLVGALVALITITRVLPGGFSEIIDAGLSAKDSGTWGKFTFFDIERRWPQVFTSQYTIWAAVIAATWGSLHPYGTDQLLVQRMFCCKGPREARKAMIFSIASQVVTFTVAFVGVGLYAYYQSNPLEGEALRLYEEKGERIFPIFIVYANAIPTGLKGLIIAGIMAAAVSSLTSILAALSQTAMSAFYEPLRRRLSGKATAGLGVSDDDVELHEHRHSVLVGRILVLFWGVALCFMAYAAQYADEKYPSILDLGLAMAGYAGGALFAGFLLGFLPLGITGRGYMWAAPLSVLYIFASVWHAPWTRYVCWGGAAVLVVIWIIGLCLRAGNTSHGRPVLPSWIQTMLLLAGCGLMVLVNYHGHWGEGPPDKFGNPTFITISWPWYVPIGSTVAAVLGYALADRRLGVTRQGDTT